MFEGYKPGEVTDLAREIYQEKIKPLVEPQESGKFIVIDVTSGDYEIDEEIVEAFDRLKARRPESVAGGLRIGHRATFKMPGIRFPHEYIQKPGGQYALL